MLMQNRKCDLGANAAIFLAAPATRAEVHHIMIFENNHYPKAF